MTTYPNPFERYPLRKRMRWRSNKLKIENSQIRSELRSYKSLGSKPNIAGRYYSENHKGRDDTIMACKTLHTVFISAVLGSGDIRERRWSRAEAEYCEMLLPARWRWYQCPTSGSWIDWWDWVMSNRSHYLPHVSFCCQCNVSKLPFLRSCTNTAAIYFLLFHEQAKSIQFVRIHWASGVPIPLKTNFVSFPGSYCKF